MVKRDDIILGVIPCRFYYKNSNERERERERESSKNKKRKARGVVKCFNKLVCFINVLWW